METSNRQITLTPDLFEPVERSADEAERISGPPISFWSDAWRRLKQNRIAVAAGVLIVLVLVLAFAGPWITPHTAYEQVLERQYKEPSLSGFWFGTDEFGRSMFDRVWVGTRISLYIAALVTVMDIGVGMTYGAISGYYGGRVDNIMQRIVEVLVGIPILVVAVLTMLILKPGILSLTIAIGLTERLLHRDNHADVHGAPGRLLRGDLELYRPRHPAAQRLARGSHQRRRGPDEVLSAPPDIPGHRALHDHHQL
jgi:oligopeptide transport system permease protein